MIIIDYDTFYDEYRPQTNHIARAATPSTVADGDIAPFSGTMYETYGDEYEYIKGLAWTAAVDTVWTVVDDGDGDPVIVSGFHTVNRLGYIVTEVPWKETTEVVEQDD